MNYFEVFGLPKILNLDLGALEKRFHELSRQYHPDYYTTASAEEKQKALRMTALLNDAYRALRHPVRRVEYLLQSEGFKPDGSKVPRSFLMEVFEINEQMEEVKSGGATKEQIDALRREIEERAANFDAQVAEASAEWDGLVSNNAAEPERKKQLTKLTEILSASSYIRNLEIVGIDLGTTNSLVAIVENGQPRVIPGPDGSKLVPSVIYFDESGEVLVGNNAKAKLVENPKNTIFSIKRFMGKGIEDVRSDIPHSSFAN
jgi:molecular chaperone HscB